MMFNGIKIISVFILAITLINVAGPCNCGNNDCNLIPNPLTPGIQFTLKDKITGQDILSPSNMGIPDSIKLFDVRTQTYLQLIYFNGFTQTGMYSPYYKRPANVIDTLVFKFGTSAPDSLIVHTGLVQSWRGDECPMVEDAGIRKVYLRNQLIVDTIGANVFIPLRK
jgi:hypothetical protein